MTTLMTMYIADVQRVESGQRDSDTLDGPNDSGK